MKPRGGDGLKLWRWCAAECDEEVWVMKPRDGRGLSCGWRLIMCLPAAGVSRGLAMEFEYIVNDVEASNVVMCDDG